MNNKERVARAKSLSVDPAVIQRVVDFLNEKPGIFPKMDGEGIVLEWDKLDITFNLNGTIECWVDNDDE